MTQLQIRIGLNFKESFEDSVFHAGSEKLGSVCMDA